MDCINLAIVGYGNIAKTHALAVQAANIKLKLPFELRITHIVTSRPNDVYLPGATITDDLQSVLNNPKVHFIDICSVNKDHLATIYACIDAQKAIYCEKPLSDNCADALKAFEAVEKSGLVNSTALMFRYIPCIHMLKEALEQNELGSIIDFYAPYYHKSYLSEQKRNSWRTKAPSGGGALLDLGVHMMDLLRLVFGEVRSIQHDKIVHFAGVEVDEICKSKLVMQSGVRGQTTSARLYAQQKQQMEIEVFCEKGSFKADVTRPYELLINYADGSSLIRKPDPNAAYAKQYPPEGAGLNFHFDGHVAAIVDIAKKVYGLPSSDYMPDFKQAYLSQLLTADDFSL